MDRSECDGGAVSRGWGVSRTRLLKVLKFGGTSVGTAERMRRVVDIVCAASAESRLVVVASAASGVTNQIVEALSAGDAGRAFDRLRRALRQRYAGLAADVLCAPSLQEYTVVLDENLERLSATLDAIVRHGHSPARHDEVLAAGERLSVPLVALALQDAGLEAVPQDAAALVRTDDAFGEAGVDIDVTYSRIRQWHAGLADNVVPVVTGFIGATASGATTTLGRSGSDYSAALLASALKVSALERWTDVDGLYTDDPRRNEKARRLDCIRLEDAVAWNHAGRLGMHRRALDPLVAAGIPVYVRSTSAPKESGTVILPAAPRQAPAAL